MINKQDVQLDRLETLPPDELLDWALEQYGDRVAIGTSLQKSGVVLIDIASRLRRPFRVFFIDTLMNPPETMDLLQRVEKRFGITIEKFAPTAESIEWLNSTVGQHAYYLARQTCCEIRKQRPLQNALASLDVWATGLRSDQSEHRERTVRRVSWVEDEKGRDILKLNPLVDWSAGQIDDYTREHDLPYHPFYDYVSEYGERYQVIGCGPCHIPTLEHLGKRAGKFPWEQGNKECGLHEKGSGI